MSNLAQQIFDKYPSWPAFLQDQSPEQLIVNYDFVNNFNDVYNTSDITLKFLSDLYNLKKSYAGYEYLERWLNFLNDFLNINKGLQPGVIKQLSYILYAKYSHFRLSDLKLLFNYILDSRYGTFYGSIDTQRISSSFFGYSNERKEAFNKIEKEIEEQQKKSGRDTPSQLPDYNKYPSLMRYSPIEKIRELAKSKTI
ncbi:MAG: hypothetical protein PHR52_11760 [Fermentimonas sp.]|nr:hypothetical protein [Fermentimonas sp.]